MRVIANTQLRGEYGLVLAGQEFELREDVGRQLLRTRKVRLPEPPRVVYETQRSDYAAPGFAGEFRGPFVTCLCITRNRLEWLPKAIQCFQEQTYPARELLVVADGADVRDLVPANDRHIRYVYAGGFPEIGEKRNFACALALGSIICHWDDDDWSGPNRITDQVGRLEATGAQVTGYGVMRFTDGRRWWEYRGDPGYVLGTSLCYRRSWWQDHPFPPVTVGEDGAFVAQAGSAGVLAAAEAGSLMYATIHAGNTSPRHVHGKKWRRL